MGHLEVSHLTHCLPDGRVLLLDVSFRVGDGAVVVDAVGVAIDGARGHAAPVGRGLAGGLPLGDVGTVAEDLHLGEREDLRVAGELDAHVASVLR